MFPDRAWWMMPLLGLLVGPVAARAQPDLDAFIAGRMAKAHAAGLAAAIIRDGEIVWARGYGQANAALGTAVTADTMFLLASVSKLPTAVAVMQLVEQGAIDLDADVNVYLPFPVRNPHHPATPITTRQLLTHTSSLAQRTDQAFYDQIYVQGDATMPLGDFLEAYFVPGGQFYDATRNFWYSYGPGTYYDYASVGFALLGYLVERVSGAAFHAHTQNHIFDGLGMDDSAWRIAGLSPERLAMPYLWTGGAQQPYGHYGFPDYPKGRLYGSVADLARFLAAIARGGEYGGFRILQATTVAQMLSPQVPSLEPSQGLGFYYSETRAGMPIVGHSGYNQGALADLWLRPSDGVGVALVTNTGTNTGGEYGAYLDVFERLFEEAAHCPLECPSTPSAACRRTIAPGGSVLDLRGAADATRNTLSWSWRGQATPAAAFGDPLATTCYRLCLYDAGTLVAGVAAPAGSTCRSRPCWKAAATQFKYSDRDGSPDGLRSLKLRAGTDGSAGVAAKGKGPRLAVPSPATLTGPLAVELHHSDGACWSADFAGPLAPRGDVLRVRSQ